MLLEKAKATPWHHRNETGRGEEREEKRKSMVLSSILFPPQNKEIHFSFQPSLYKLKIEYTPLKLTLKKLVE